jgi:hypothetical protein
VFDATKMLPLAAKAECARLDGPGDFPIRCTARRGRGFTPDTALSGVRA